MTNEDILCLVVMAIIVLLLYVCRSGLHNDQHNPYYDYKRNKRDAP